ncbi:uncharacterized protein LOC121405852 isoform X2 [Lytechinus variegatus]|uniref:uncharacterized protein LOC121405852 isoform X2 n=1 Tax=Lytechinus variegatus TaxID=7654 RepID=UPI001BB12E09|nr:uncharacterized protein LOC121405852 isoform X2 [Lytechinus variegatus]
MEGTSDAGSKVKDERSDEDEVTIVEDADEAQENGGGRSSEGTSAKKKDAVDQERSQSSNVFEYNMQSVLHVDEDMSPIESRQDSHGTNVDSDFQASMDQGLDQGGWSWNKESEVPHGSREIVPASKGSAKVRRFQCGICGTNFTLLKNAKRHYRCQHLNYFYWCKYCPRGKETRRYTRREFLEDHFLSYHPDIMCEVEEVGKSCPTDEYNIICVDIYEDEVEEDDVGVDVVTTTDTIPQGTSTLEQASSRGIFEGSVLLHNTEQRDNVRSETNIRGNYINLADYHGFANDSHHSNGSGAVAGSSQKRMQRTSPVNQQSNKVRRVENERIINMDCDMPYAEGMLHERDVSQGANRWVSPVGQSHQSQVNLSVPNQSASTSSRSLGPFPRQDGSYVSHPMLHAQSANTHDCLVIGSAITPLEKDTMTPSPPSVRPSSKHTSPQIASSSTRPPSGQSVMQNMHQPKRKNHFLPNQRQLISLGPEAGRSMNEDGNVVISSSDASCRKQPREASQRQQRSKEVVVIEGDAPATTVLSCKEIFEKYHDSIGKYSKEIDFKYDSSGRVVRRKVIKHTFVFSNSQMPVSLAESKETQAGDRSASR